MDGARSVVVACALGLVTLAGCGARSELREPSPSHGNAGGAGSGGSASIGGSSATGGSDTTTSGPLCTKVVGTGGASGGVPLAMCTQLAYVTPFATMEAGSLHERSPQLAFSSEDRARVTLVTALHVDVGAGPLGAPALRHTSLEPWGDFPAGAILVPNPIAKADGGTLFSVAQGFGDHFAIAFKYGGEEPALLFSSHYSPGSGDIPEAIHQEYAGDSTSALARGSKRFAYFSSSLFQGAYQGMWYKVEDDQMVDGMGACCTPGRPSADLFATEGFFYGACIDSAAGETAEACATKPPKRVLTQRFSELPPYKANVGASVDAPNVTEVRLAPRSTGGWVVWAQLAGGSVQEGIRFAQMDETAEGIGPTSEWLVPYVKGSLAAASFDDQLMIAWIDPGCSEPHVQMFDAEGAPLGETVVYTSGDAQPPLALLAAPEGHSALLAWSETRGAGESDRVRVTRLDCAGETP